MSVERSAEWSVERANGVPAGPGEPVDFSGARAALADLAAGTAALAAEIATTSEELARLRAGTYRGRDPGGLVAAEIDGDGMVTGITFVPTIARHHPTTVGEAVCAAVAAAQRRLGEAVGAVATRGLPAPQASAGPPGPDPDLAGLSGAPPVWEEDE